eukprot:163718-Hanusia_phi.AAC.1
MKLVEFQIPMPLSLEEVTSLLSPTPPALYPSFPCFPHAGAVSAGTALHGRSHDQGAAGSSRVDSPLMITDKEQ